MKPHVTVIVLTYNKYYDTVECLESVADLEYPCFDVVLVDNHSTDGSIAKIKTLFPEIHYLENSQNLGVAGGRNSGARYARENTPAEYLLFLDNDTVVHAKTLALLADCLNTHPEVVIACGKTYTAPPSTTIMSVGMTVNLYTGVITDIGSGEEDIGQYEQAGYVTACGGFGFMVRATDFEKCDGLDEDYSPYGWEDVDFSLRAAKKGYRAYYVPDAVLYHKGCKIGRGYVPEYEKYKVKNYFRLLNRHTTLLQKTCCIVCIPPRGLWALIKLVAKGRFGIVVSQLSGAVALLLRRKRTSG